MPFVEPKVALRDHYNLTVSVERPRFVASTISAAGTTTWDSIGELETLIQPMSPEENILLGRMQTRCTHRGYCPIDANVRAYDRLVDASIDAWYDWLFDDLPLPEWHVQAIVNPAGKNRYQEMLLIEYHKEKS